MKIQTLAKAFLIMFLVAGAFFGGYMIYPISHILYVVWIVCCAVAGSVAGKIKIGE